jgi:hypothetical protein
MSKISLHIGHETTGLRDYEVLACLEVSCPEVKGKCSLNK